jgi:hypothetical protein
MDEIVSVPVPSITEEDARDLGARVRTPAVI